MKRVILRTSVLACGLAFGLTAAPMSFAEDHDKAHDKKELSGHKKSDKAFNPQEFLKGAVAANVLEIQSAELAQTQSQNAEVKQLASTLAQHHREAQKDLDRLAQKHGVQSTMNLEGKHKGEFDQLKGKQGQAFDKAYIQHVISDHQRDISMMKECSQKLTDHPEFKSLIDRNLPKMEQHLASAKQINKSANLGVAITESGDNSASGAAATSETSADHSIDVDTSTSTRADVESSDDLTIDSSGVEVDANAASGAPATSESSSSSSELESNSEVSIDADVDATTDSSDYDSRQDSASGAPGTSVSESASEPLNDNAADQERDALSSPDTSIDVDVNTPSDEMPDDNSDATVDPSLEANESDLNQTPDTQEFDLKDDEVLGEPETDPIRIRENDLVIPE